jgi:hypothetical protein
MAFPIPDEPDDPGSGHRQLVVRMQCRLLTLFDTVGRVPMSDERATS